jgi:hypothetical protein
MPFSALKNAVLSEKIDWIAYTQAIQVDWTFPDYIEDKWKDIRCLAHFNKAQENPQGVRRYWHTENLKQGRYVVMDAAALDTLQEYQLDVLQSVNTPLKKATRIDFALDILHSSFRPEMVQARLRRGEAVTHAQSAPTYNDQLLEGFTQYVGRKSSETYTRVYDKAVEQGTPYAWIRVETVYQGSRAQPALRAFCEGASARALIRSHVDFPNWRLWQDLLSYGTVKLHVPKKETRTREWLLTTVSKSIAKEIAMDEDHSFWFQLIEAIGKELAILGEEW